MRHQGTLHHIGFAVKLAQFFALGHLGAHTGFGEESRDACATGTQLLGQGALRREVQFQFTRQELALKLFVLAHVAGNHFFDLPRFQQLAQAKAIDPGVVGNDGEVFHAAVAQGVNQRFGNAAQAKPANGHQLAVGHDVLEGFFRGWENFVQSNLLISLNSFYGGCLA